MTRHPLDANQFRRMARAIEYLYDHAQQQPNLATVAAHVHLSPAHCQRQFSDWVGISPKKLLQYLNVSRAKALLRQHHSVAATALATGLSGGGRLHDLFVHIEGMTPGEYKHGGANLSLAWQWLHSPFGAVLAAASDKGVCHLAFADDANAALTALCAAFPQARLSARSHPWLTALQSCLNGDSGQRLPLHIKGTPFQIKVWEALLHIPSGTLTSYGRLAADIGHPKAARAVGSAVGANPVALLIPCHRVIRASGIIGDYRWQRSRKLALLDWEMAQQDGNSHAD